MIFQWISTLPLPPKKNKRLFKSKPGGYNLTIWATLRIYQPQEIHGKNQPCHTQPREANWPDSLPEVLLFVDVEIMSYTLPKSNSEFTPEKCWLEDHFKNLGRLLFRGELFKTFGRYLSLHVQLDIENLCRTTNQLTKPTHSGARMQCSKSPSVEASLSSQCAGPETSLFPVDAALQRFQVPCKSRLACVHSTYTFYSCWFSWREKKGNYVFS